MAGHIEAVLTAVLTHRWALAVKRPIRDAWWRLRGLPIRRAPLPSNVQSILFVCKGNICRSPFAEHLAARLLDEAGRRGVRCASAGLAVSAEGVSPKHAVEAARAFGIDLDGHRACQLTEEMMEEYDLVVVTEVPHVEILRRRHPSAMHRVALLPLYGRERTDRHGYARYNIADPYGKAADVFAVCYAQISHGLADLLGTIRAESMSTRALDVDDNDDTPSSEGRSPQSVARDRQASHVDSSRVVRHN